MSSLPTKIKRRDINKINADGETPLTHCIPYSNIKTIKLLLENEADPNIIDGTGVSALMLASNANFTDVIKLLIDYKADLNLKSLIENTALHFAVVPIKHKIYNPKTVKLLLENKANPNIKNIKGDTPLISISIRKYEDGRERDERAEIVKLLVEYKAELDAQNKKGQTALMYAAKNELHEIADILMENNVDPTIKSTSGKTALDVCGSDVSNLPTVLEKYTTLYLLKQEVKNESGDTTTVFPFPLAGGHILGFNIILDYLFENYEEEQLYEIESDNDTNPVDNWSTAIAEAELERQRKYLKDNVNKI